MKRRKPKQVAEDYNGHLAEVLFGEVTAETREKAKVIDFTTKYGRSGKDIFRR